MIGFQVNDSLLIVQNVLQQHTLIHLVDDFPRWQLRLKRRVVNLLLIPDDRLQRYSGTRANEWKCIAAARPCRDHPASPLPSCGTSDSTSPPTHLPLSCLRMTHPPLMRCHLLLWAYPSIL